MRELDFVDNCYSTIIVRTRILLYPFNFLKEERTGRGRKLVETRARPSHSRQFQPPLVLSKVVVVDNNNSILCMRGVDSNRPIRKQLLILWVGRVVPPLIIMRNLVLSHFQKIFCLKGILSLSDS